MTTAEKIYHAIGEGYGFNGSKEEAVKVIEDILNYCSQKESEPTHIKKKADILCPRCWSPDHYKFGVRWHACNKCGMKFT